VWGIRYWPVFLSVASAFFLIPELIALFTNASNTLSDYCWNQLHVNVSFGHGAHTVAWWFSLVAWFMFVVLITIHIWWRGP
jgi:hypothetical protein